MQPWSSTNKYADDELCHDGYAGVFAKSVHRWSGCCTRRALHFGWHGNGYAGAPERNGWYTSYNSQLPFNGTSAAVPFKWVRISPEAEFFCQLSECEHFHRDDQQLHGKYHQGRHDA